MAGDDGIYRQLVEELDGSRRLGNKGRAAVRLADLDGLLQLPASIAAAKAAGAAPTKAEFDLLIDDVTILYTRLNAVIQALRGRRGR